MGWNSLLGYKLWFSPKPCFVHLPFLIVDDAAVLLLFLLHPYLLGAVPGGHHGSLEFVALRLAALLAVDYS